MTLFAISVNIKHFFVRLNSAEPKVFICEKRKLPFLCLKHHLHKNLKRTGMRHSQTVYFAFWPLFAQAWKLLPEYFLFLLSKYYLELGLNIIQKLFSVVTLHAITLEDFDILKITMQHFEIIMLCLLFYSSLDDLMAL